MFSKNVRIIYLYLVCLITLFMVIGGIIATIYNISEYVLPDNNYYGNNVYDYMDTKIKADSTPISAEEYEEFAKIQEIENQRAISRNKKQDLKEIIYSFTICVVALPIYIYNWRKIEKERKESIQTESVGE